MLGSTFRSAGGCSYRNVRDDSGRFSQQTLQQNTEIQFDNLFTESHKYKIISIIKHGKDEKNHILWVCSKCHRLHIPTPPPHTHTTFSHCTISPPLTAGKIKIQINILYNSFNRSCTFKVIFLSFLHCSIAFQINL